MSKEIISVTWKDSHSMHGWTTNDELEDLINKDIFIETIGFLIHEDDEIIIISSSICKGGTIDSPILIPKCCIKKRGKIFQDSSLKND